MDRVESEAMVSQKRRGTRSKGATPRMIQDQSGSAFLVALLMMIGVSFVTLFLTVNL